MEIFYKTEKLNLLCNTKSIFTKKFNSTSAWVKLQNFSIRLRPIEKIENALWQLGSGFNLEKLRNCHGYYSIRLTKDIRVFMQQNSSNYSEESFVVIDIIRHEYKKMCR